MRPPPEIRFHPVSRIDGTYHIRIGPRVMPLRMGSEPIAAFNPGWAPSLVYTGLAPFAVLQFDGPGGQTACWLLDGAANRLGGSVDELLPADRDALRAIAAPLLRRLVNVMLCHATPVLDPELRAFAAMPAEFRQSVALLCAGSSLPAPHKLVLSDHPTQWDGTWLIGRQHVEAAFGPSFQDRLLAIAQDGTLRWPSLVDGRSIVVQGSLCSEEFRFAYRLADDVHDLVAYVLVSHHHATIVGLYVPALNLLIVPDGWANHLLGVYFTDVSWWFVDIVCGFASLLEPYLAEGARRVAGIMRGPPSNHIGHQLWNEVGGIEWFIRSTGRPPPGLVVPGGASTELWGAADALFPQLAGLVDRASPDSTAAIVKAYEDRVCLVRITGEHVSSEVRTGLRRTVQDGPAWTDVRATLEQINARRAPVVVLGLRVENRTAADLPAVCERFVRLLAAAFPGAVVVVDAHNSNEGGATIDSHGESMAARPPVLVERGIAERLRALQQEVDVTVIDTLGKPVRTSLAWCAHADCFFSFWGASLAKYRWASNLQGLVVSSRHNLLYRGDLHIYDDPLFMEEPTRLEFVAADLVDDRPDAALLVDPDPGNPIYFNFALDADRVFEQFRPVIERTWTPPG